MKNYFRSLDKFAWGRNGFDGCRGVRDSRPRISGPSLIIQEKNLIADNYNYAMAA